MLNSVVQKNIPFISSWMCLATSPMCVGLIHYTSRSHLVSTRRKEKITYNLNRFILCCQAEIFLDSDDLKFLCPSFYPESHISYDSNCVNVYVCYVCVWKCVCARMCFFCVSKGDMGLSFLRNRNSFLQVLRLSQYNIVTQRMCKMFQWILLLTEWIGGILKCLLKNSL